MEATTLQVFLRVLYTVNSNPQYILAKSSSQVPVTTCGETAVHLAMDEPAYARAPLKACLAAVCDSSPELLQDPTRDFSLYFLDPLETQPLPTSLAPHNTSSPRGVAVALGLMSWALESNDSANVFVTGTIIPNASPAVEVVCALRETKRMPRPMSRSYPSLGPPPAPSLPRSLNPPLVSGASLRSDQEQRQTLTRSADFPELYIGPPRRARGRPEGSTSSKVKAKAQATTSSLAGRSSSAVAGTQTESKREGGKRSKQKTKQGLARDPPTYSPFVCAPLARNAAAATPEGHAVGTPTLSQQPHPSNQNQIQSNTQFHSQAQLQFLPTSNPLLGLLSAISSASSGNTPANTTPEQQTAVLSALQGLLGANPHLLQLLTTSTSVTNVGERSCHGLQGGGDGGDGQDDGDSDIIILDSSTIDPTVFRKSSARQQTTSDHDVSPFTDNQVSPSPSNEGIASSPLPASTPLSGSGSESAPTSSRTSTPFEAPDSTSAITADAQTPTSKHSRQATRADGTSTTPFGLDIPTTPTARRTRKRKLEEYRQGQGRSATPTPPPSPSPSVARTSSSVRALTTKNRVWSSPTGGRKALSSPSVRLPSMLSSMHNAATLGSHPQAGSSGYPTHRHLGTLTSDDGPLVSRPTKAKAVHAPNTDTCSSGAPSSVTSLKRRRTLTEFMAEQEALQSLRAPRKRSLSARKSGDDVFANTSRLAALATADLGSTSRYTRSSPSRSLFRSDSIIPALPLSTSIPHVGLAPGIVAVDPVPPSANTTIFARPPGPSAPASTPPEMNNPLKNFVLPAWARTSTAMLPRLSEEALARQQAEREAKKAQASVKRREAARAKRKRQRDLGRPSKESSDEDDEIVESNTKMRPPSSVVRGGPLPQPQPPLSLPVFASDTVEPIPSSPPRSPPPPIVPSTPPRKPMSSSRSGAHRTPGKSGSCSLFTPSGPGSVPLFTPNTPSVTRSLTRTAFTPRSPTAVRHSGSTKKSPRKSLLQTPRRNSGDRPTPRSVYTGRNPSFVSPSMAAHTPLTQMGMSTRAFLLPPPSPCSSRIPQHLDRAASNGLSPMGISESWASHQGPVSGTEDAKWDKDCNEDDTLNRELGEALLGEDSTLPPAACSLSSQTQGESEQQDTTTGGDAETAEDYASSPLPPSSPLPASPLSSPAKHDNLDMSDAGFFDSDILLPTTNDSDGPQTTTEPAWLSDDTSTDVAAWFTDPEASAWLTETETWLTDTEGGGGGPLLSDSDGTWLSDSDAVFGDKSSLASNWLSDDADLDTDEGDFSVLGDNGIFDAVAFQRVFVSLVENGGEDMDKNSPLDGGTPGSSAATHTHDAPSRVVQSDSEFWRSMQPLLGRGSESTSNDVVTSEVAQDIQTLLESLVGT